MAVREVQVTKYRSDTDGVTYDTLEQAERAEFIAAVSGGLELSSNMTPAEVLDEIFENRVKIMGLLSAADVRIKGA